MTDPSALLSVLPSDQTFRRLLQLAGPQTGADLLARLVQDLLAVQEGLIFAVTPVDWDALRAHSHVLVALAGAVGATPLQTLAEDLNRAANVQQAAVIPALMDKALPRLATLIEYMSEQHARPDQMP